MTLHIGEFLGFARRGAGGRAGRRLLPEPPRHVSHRCARRRQAWVRPRGRRRSGVPGRVARRGSLGDWQGLHLASLQLIISTFVGHVGCFQTPKRLRHRGQGENLVPPCTSGSVSVSLSRLRLTREVDECTPLLTGAALLGRRLASNAAGEVTVEVHHADGRTANVPTGCGSAGGVLTSSRPTLN